MMDSSLDRVLNNNDQEQDLEQVRSSTKQVVHLSDYSVMDILNLWNDDPEEVLLDLGFGNDEPDLSGRIPARFINYQSQARGINLNVFMEAQKNRLDLENPDVNNRYRQLEIFQQVTTAFSSLVGCSSSPFRASQVKDLPPEALEKRRRIGLLFRRASKKSLSQINTNKTKDRTTTGATSPPCAEPEPLHPPSQDNTRVKRGTHGPQEMVCLDPLVEEPGPGPDPVAQPHMVSLTAQEEAVRPWPLTEGPPVTAYTFPQRKNQGNVRESFEMDEIHSFDDSGLSGSYPGAALHLGQCVKRRNSCQSDSSGFLEELFIPQVSPGSKLIKVLSGLSRGSSDSQSTGRPGSPIFHTSPSLLPSSSLTSLGDDKSLLASSHSSTQHSFISDPFSCPPSLSLLKHGPQISETEKPPNCDHSVSKPSTALPSSAACNSLSAKSSQPGSLIRGSEIIKTENEASPHHLPSLSCDADSTAWLTFSVIPPHNSSPSPSPNVDHPFFSALIGVSPTQSDSQSEKTEVALHEHSLSNYGGLSFLLPSSPFTALSQESNQKDYIFSGSSDIGLSDLPKIIFKKKEEMPSSLYKDSSFISPCLILDSMCKNASAPCLSSLSSQSHDPHGHTNPVSDLREQSILQQDISQVHTSTESAPAVPVQHAPHVKMDYLCMRNGMGEEHGDTVQTREAVVYSSDTESIAALSQGSRAVSVEECNHSETKPQFLSWTLLPTETKPELRKVCPMEMNVTGRKLPKSSLVSHDTPEAQSTTLVKPHHLIEINHLDLMFHTSVDDSDSESEDVEDFFQQVDTEGLVYWAEPIQVSNHTPELEDSNRSPVNSLLKGPDTLDSSTGTAMSAIPSFSQTMDRDQNLKHVTTCSDKPSSLCPAPLPSLSTVPDLKPSSRSVSVQMSSSLSSHIVHRKDVPFVTDSKYTPPPIVLPLDTSTPFRAVQSWTDLQIQRNTVSRKSHKGLHPAPKKAGLWPTKDQGRTESEDKEKLWEDDQTATMSYCCACDHQCSCSTFNKQNTVENLPCSLDELEEMMLCLQQFFSVFSNMEEQLSDDQTAVDSVLSDQDRKNILDIEELRRAVKQEAGELEMQLTELVHHCDDSLKRKMHRLLDEQSLLCSQLRLFPPGTVASSVNVTTNRTVATQCCLLPLMTQGDISSWNEHCPRQSPPGTESPCEGMCCYFTQADKLDIVDFLHR